MAYYDKVNTDLRLKLFTQLIIENHPSFCEGSSLRAALLETPSFFNIEHIVETMLEACCDGQYKFNNGTHEDFTDGSDSKTGTLYTKGDASTAEITSVCSKDGVLKKAELGVLY
jgi:hypothetical protein